MQIQKFEYLENKKSFLDEIKNIFHSFWRAIIWLKIKNWWKIVDTSFKIKNIKCTKNKNVWIYENIQLWKYENIKIYKYGNTVKPV